MVIIWRTVERGRGASVFEDSPDMVMIENEGLGEKMAARKLG